MLQCQSIEIVNMIVEYFILQKQTIKDHLTFDFLFFVLVRKTPLFVCLFVCFFFRFPTREL